MIEFLVWLVSDNCDEVIRISHMILDFEVCHEMPASARLLPAFLSAVVCANPDSPESAEAVLRLALCAFLFHEVSLCAPHSSAIIKAVLLSPFRIVDPNVPLPSRLHKTERIITPQLVI
jgi:hypothetical protein